MLGVAVRATVVILKVVLCCHDLTLTRKRSDVKKYFNKKTLAPEGAR